MESLAHSIKILQMPLIRNMRAFIMRHIRPRQRYLSSFTTRPISTKYGFDRGLPVDRFYIEEFLKNNCDRIQGVCLEVVDSSYTVKFGAQRVTKSNVIDIFKTRRANICGDLRNMRGVVADSTYDTIILTQTLNFIDDYDAAIAECVRILKPGGTLLVTLPTISPTWSPKINLWRFSERSARYIFEKFFEPKKLNIAALGTKIAAESFWLGMSVQDLTSEELTGNDATYPVIIGIVAIK